MSSNRSPSKNVRTEDRPRRAGIISLTVLLLCLSMATLGLLVQARQDKPERLSKAGQPLAHCPESPNCVCSRDQRKEFRIEPLPLDPQTGRKSLDALAALIEELPGARRVILEPDYARFEFQSRLFGFIDDVELEIPPDSPVIHLRSASRTGHHDLGVNRQRAQTIRARWLQIIHDVRP